VTPNEWGHGDMVTRRSVGAHGLHGSNDREISLALSVLYLPTRRFYVCYELCAP
jgi:hypothetical protein